MLRGIEEALAVLACTADVLETCLTRQFAVARAAAPRRIAASVTKFLAGMGLIATEHRAEAVEPQRAANHAGGGRRRGAQKGPAAATVILRHRLLILLVLLRRIPHAAAPAHRGYRAAPIRIGPEQGF